MSHSLVRKRTTPFLLLTPLLTLAACHSRKRTIQLLRLAPLLALAACQSPQQQVAQREDNLAAAGFTIRPANTPERQEMLNRLPPHHFVQRGSGDNITFVYSDPLVCDCLYIGDQAAYNRYQAYVQQKNLADQQARTAQMWSDARWNWGPWGPFGPNYVFVPGPGF